MFFCPKKVQRLKSKFWRRNFLVLKKKIRLFQKQSSKDAREIMWNVSSVPFTKNHPPTTAGYSLRWDHFRFHKFSFISTSDVCVCVCVACTLWTIVAFSSSACNRVEDSFLFTLKMPNADDDSVSGVCCSTAVPARGGDILTRSGVRLGIICTYIIYLFTYMLYIRTHILHIKYIRIYIYKVKETKKKKKKKNTT